MTGVPALPVTGSWAPLFAGYSAYLTFRVIRARLESKVLIGDGTLEELKCSHEGQIGDVDQAKCKALRTTMRTQANFVETVPLALVLIAVLESNRANPKAIHALLGTLFVARILHGHFGMLWNSQAMGSGRPLGMLLTNGVILVSGIYNGVI
ncbi:hypothetical protein Unana1_04966, partial [Umbelopsis nana]